MKKINSIFMGRFLIVLFLLDACVITVSILLAFVWGKLYIESFGDALTLFTIPATFFLITIHLIKIGCWSCLKIDDTKISNKDYSLEWKNVFITFTINRHTMYARHMRVGRLCHA